MNGHPAWNALMFGDGNTVALLSPKAMEFIVTPAGACEPKRTKITLPEPGAEFTGADLLPGGDLVVSIQTRSGQSTSMTLYRWLGEQSAWEKIPAPVMDSGQPWRGHLLGADGDALWLSAGGSKAIRHPLSPGALSAAPSRASHVSARE